METLEVLEKYLRGRKLSRETEVSYRKVFKSLAECSPEFPSKGVIVNEWLAGLKLADTSIQLYYRRLKAVCRYMYENYELANPCEKLRTPKVEKRKRRYFTSEELMRIIKACVSRVEELLIYTLIDSTCRIGELVDLKGGDVGEGIIKVRGKTGERHYRLDLKLCEALREMADSDEDYVFKKYVGGGRTNSNALRSRVRIVIKRAGIRGRKVGPHTLRHSGASMVARESGSVLAVKAVLQQEDVKSSMIYVHDIEDSLKQVYSPLKILRESLVAEGDGDVLQLGMGSVGVGDGVAVAVVEKPDDGWSAVLEGDLKEISDDVEVRPLLKADDLRLIRGVFIDCIKAGVAGSREGRMISLLRRMVRKVK